MNTDGSGRTRLTYDLGDRAEYPGWSPDGRKIAFNVYNFRDNAVDIDIYTMNADGSEQINLTADIGIVLGEDTQRDWSPDSRQIAFVTQFSGNREVYVMNADGIGKQNLTNNPADDYWPRWSFDGSKIAFTSSRDGKSEIYVMNADGSGQTNLSNYPGQDSNPEWSLTASKIAFVRDLNAGGEIYLMNADGSGLQNLTGTPHREWDPEWSADGSRIAFMSNREGNFNIGSFQVYVMNADGSGQARVTTLYDSVIGDPKWSPDGTRISFRRGLYDNEVYVIRVDGSRLTDLTDSPASDLRGRWQPTGN